MILVIDQMLGSTWPTLERDLLITETRPCDLNVENATFKLELWNHKKNVLTNLQVGERECDH